MLASQCLPFSYSVEVSSTPATLLQCSCFAFNPFLSNSYIWSSQFKFAITRPRFRAAQGVLRDIQDSAVIACLRAPSAQVAIKAARAAFTGGISVLEVTMSNPNVFEILKDLVQEYPSASIGVGTILQISDAEKALSFGAKFLMSPVMIKSIFDIAANHDALYIPGAMTPTEILSAYNFGAKIVKVYPVSAMGGVSYIAAIKKPFPHIPLVASQGITLDSLGEYISRGAFAVVISDAIFDRKAMDQLDFDRITLLASLAVQMSNRALASAST